eukprot:TRINITY_DN4675_c0_g1_i2.p1 TRINITY_DN4675_c0_g1~~TRINITY_DN4675_c0_g1_i2.p1  ORF type:complete len:220 (+),score=80.90 TRINITY_DN4675_c0_g1_i2:669-1328(+)
MLPGIKEKIEKLKGVKISDDEKTFLLQKHAAVSKLVDEKQKQIEKNRAKYEGYIQKLKELFQTGELALSNVYPVSLYHRITRKEEKVKKLDDEMKIQRQNTDSLKLMLEEKKRDMAIASGEYELTIRQFKSDLEESQKLISMMEESKKKLLATLSDKNKELEEKDELLREKEEKIQNELEEIGKLNVELVKMGRVGHFNWLTWIMLVVVAVVFAVIIWY